MLNNAHLPRGKTEMGLSPEFTVCSGAGCCVGVTGGGKEGEVTISFKSGAVQVYNVR